MLWAKCVTQEQHQIKHFSDRLWTTRAKFSAERNAPVLSKSKDQSRVWVNYVAIFVLQTFSILFSIRVYLNFGDVYVCAWIIFCLTVYVRGELVRSSQHPKQN